MTLGDVIKKYREEHSLSMDSFSKASGISKAYISLLEKNKHPKTGKEIAPSIDIIKQAASGMGLDFDYLFNMIDDEVDLSRQPLPPYTNIHPITKQSLPVLGEVSCGEPRFMADQIEYYTDQLEGIHADFVLIAHGDSMIGARIHDGDLVFIRKQEEVENGEIAAVAIGDEATLKRVFFYANKSVLVLRAENPDFKDMEYSGSELADVHVLGKAVAFQSVVK